MKLTLSKRSPIPDGVYPVKVLGVREIRDVVTKNGLRDKIEFSFMLMNEEELEFTCSLFWSGYELSPYAQFIFQTMENFGIEPDEELDTDDFVGKIVYARFGSYRMPSGDEYLTLEWFKPYKSEREVMDYAD